MSWKPILEFTYHTGEWENKLCSVSLNSALSLYIYIYNMVQCIVVYYTPREINKI